MTVRDLIEVLSEFDEECDAIIPCQTGGWIIVSEVYDSEDGVTIS